MGFQDKFSNMELQSNGSPTLKLKSGFLLIAVTALFLYTWQFHSGTYDNAASRLDLAYSLAVHNTASIDRFHNNTIDKAFFEGHYYSDKAPGLSIAAWPVLKILSTIAPDVAWHPDNQDTNWLLVLLVIGIPSIIALYFLYNICSNIMGGPAVIPVLIYATGSLALPYSTLFYSHQFCAALLVALFYIYFSQLSGTRIPSLKSGILCGLLGGWAAISEYTVAVPAVIILLAAVLNSKKTLHAVGILIGVAVPAAVLLWYNRACFGSPFHIGYMYEVNDWFREEMGKGAGGVTYPNLVVLVKLLFQPQRGLLWEHPFIMLAVPGLYFMLRSAGQKRNIAVVSLLIAAATLLINASYYEPYGGFSPGPRFLITALPFLFIPAAFAWNRLGAVLKGVFAGAGLYSILLFSVTNSVEPHVPHIYMSPLTDFIIPLLDSGYIPRTVPALPALSPALYFLIILSIVIFAFVAGFHKYTDKEPSYEGWSGLIIGTLVFGVIFMTAAMIIKPEKVMSAYYLGAAMNVNKQYDRAEVFFLEAVAEKPDFFQAWYSLGISQTKIAQFDNIKYNDSIASFEETLRINPDFLQGYISLAALNLTLSRFEEAEYRLSEGLKKFPDNPVLMQLKQKTSELSEEAYNKNE